MTFKFVCTPTIARIYLTNSKNIVVFLESKHDNKNVKV
ncbi:hypothetical protein ACVPOS_01775 [Staphylococcus aureus]